MDRSLGYISSSIGVVEGLSHTPSLTALLIELRDLNNTATKLAGEVTCSNLHRKFRRPHPPTPAHTRTVHAPTLIQTASVVIARLIGAPPHSLPHSLRPPSVLSRCHGCHDCHGGVDEFAGAIGGLCGDAIDGLFMLVGAIGALSVALAISACMIRKVQHKKAANE